ncbi:MAG: recombination protein RecR [Actinobacteria bacterium]|nr:recombination protein RecR [Actinomycetota bacterium]
MSAYPPAVQELIDEFGRLPGIGPKSAQRIALYLVNAPLQDATRLARSIDNTKARIGFCTRCHNMAEDELCSICSDPRRDPSVICVVEEARDLIAVERTGEFHGLYHVLGGVISPIEGIGPDQLHVRDLVVRLSDERVTELIVCTNPNIEGETTALYLARLLADTGIRITRLASGLPVGGDLEYADELTLGRAIEARRRLDAPGT